MQLDLVKYKFQLVMHWAQCINTAINQGANEIQIRALRCLADFEFRLKKLRDPCMWITRVDRDGDVTLRFIASEITSTGCNINHDVEVAIDIFGIMTTVNKLTMRQQIFNPFEECIRFGDNLLMWVLDDSFFEPFTERDYHDS